MRPNPSLGVREDGCVPTRRSFRSPARIEGISKEEVNRRVDVLARVHPDDLYATALELTVQLTTPPIPTLDDTRNARIECERKDAMMLSSDDKRKCGPVRPSRPSEVTGMPASGFKDGVLNATSSNSSTRTSATAAPLSSGKDACDKVKNKLNDMPASQVWALLSQSVAQVDVDRRDGKKGIEDGGARFKAALGRTGMTDSAALQLLERPHALRALVHSEKGGLPFFCTQSLPFEQWKALLIQISFASHFLFQSNVEGWNHGLTTLNTARFVDSVRKPHPETGEECVFPRVPFHAWCPFELHSREFRDEFKGLCQPRERYRGFPKGCFGEEHTVRGRIWLAARESFRRMLELEGMYNLFSIETSQSVLSEEQVTGLLVLSKLNETAGPHTQFYDVGFFFCGNWHAWQCVGAPL